MARYNVQMTFETPEQHSRLRSIKRLPGRIGSMHLLGGDGFLAVSASGVSAESPADAAMIVVKAVQGSWSKRRGRLTMRSWTAHRERVLFGSRRGSDSAWSGAWDWDDGDEGGSAGVREPRRPLPGPGSLHAARDI
ncbi:MAG TPA: hypothetical protein VLL08_11950 [Kineosporiaceae bacterium]|nr:hypothetical protein [Kineosporiaceae bacterium]